MNKDKIPVGMKEFEIEGVWWLPDNPDFEFAGILSFHPSKGGTLRVIGNNYNDLISHRETTNNSEELSPYFGFNDKPLNIIIGMTLNEPVTLCNCHPTTTRLGGYSSITFTIEMILSGYHFEHTEDLIFSSLLINYSHLESWYNKSGLRINYKQRQEGKRTGFTVDYQPPSEISSHVRNFNITFKNLTHSNYTSTTFFAEEKTFVEIKPDVPLQFNDYSTKIIYYFQNLLTFALSTPVTPYIILGKIPELSNSDILILYPTRAASLVSDKVDHTKILFRLVDLIDHLDEYLNQWFDNSDAIESPINLFFGMFYTPGMYLHLQFLTLVQALENYQSIRFGHESLYLPEEDFKILHSTLINALPKNLSEAHRESIKSRINYFNEFSLANRIKMLIEKLIERGYQRNIESILDGNKPKDFARIVAELRNPLSHGDKTIVKDSQLREVIKKLISVFQLCFLIELGLPSKKIKELMDASHRW